MKLKINQWIPLALCTLSMSNIAFALNYFELETYGFKTESEGEVEIKNTFTTGQESKKVSNDTKLRNTLEVEYGLTSHWTLGIYGDFDHLANKSWAYRGLRLKAQTRFGEAGENFLDFGAYGELEFWNKAEHPTEIELKAIIEKTWDRLALKLNPGIEYKLIGSGEKEIEPLYSVSLTSYHFGRLEPRIDQIGDIEGKKYLAGMGLEYSLSDAWDLDLAYHTGLNQKSERHLISFGIVTEF